jgi:hypothetical protein
VHRHHRRSENQRQQKNAAAYGRGQLAPCGPAQWHAYQQRHPHGGADERESIGNLVEAHLMTTLTTIAVTRIKATMNTRAQSTTMPATGSLVIGE